MPDGKDIPRMNDGTRLLMCPPDYFAVDYAINPWMDPALWRKQARRLAAESRREWRDLHRRLLDFGAAVELVPPMAGLPDLVFTANAAIVMDGVALLARFRHPERRREEAHFARAFRNLWGRGVIAALRKLPEGMTLEGAGDCVWDASRRLFWMGYGPRSDRDAASVVRDLYGIETLALELADARFYHMDTALCPLPRGEVMYVPSAFTPEGVARIHDRVAPELRIALGAEDAGMLAANAIRLGDNLVLSDCGEALRTRLDALGYRVRRTPLDSFHRSGGSAFCLTLRLDQRSASDGATLRRAKSRAARSSFIPAAV